MTLQGILASVIFFILGYLFVRWASRKRKAAKKAKVVNMEMEDYDYETYHKN